MDNDQTCEASDAEKPARGETGIHKRRSLVFHSRAASSSEQEDTKGAEDAQETLQEEGPKDSDKKKREKKAEEEEEYFDLREYVAKLRRERRVWIETWKQRKAERKSLTAKKLSLEARGQSVDLNVLSDAERAFVLARPNYEQICESKEKLLAVAMKVATLNQLARKLNQRFISQMEEKLYDVTKRIIKISES